MTCTDYAVLLEKYLDGSLTSAEEAQLHQHEANCPACAAHRRMLDRLQDDLPLLADAPAMPDDFHQHWMKRVEDDAMENRERNPRTRMPLTRILSTAAALVFVLGGTLLTRDTLSPRSADTISANNAAQGIYVEDATAEYEEAGTVGVMLTSASATSGTRSSTRAATNSTTDAPEQKIIRTASLTIGTQHYEDTLATLRQMGEEAGGWVSYSSENVTSEGLRRAYLTLRLPSDQLDDYLTSSGALGRVISKNESATDVTESYYDTQARLDTQLALMERLQSLMTDAADLADLLELESKIADTQYTIDSLQASLNSTDSQVNYATVDISLREENSASALTDSEQSLGQRLVNALETGLNTFVDFLEDALVFLTAALPFIAIVFVCWLILRITRRRRK